MYRLPITTNTCVITLFCKPKPYNLTFPLLFHANKNNVSSKCVQNLLYKTPAKTQFLTEKLQNLLSLKTEPRIKVKKIKVKNNKFPCKVVYTRQNDQS